MSDYPWWKGGVIYQIYPRSFLDTNDDGIGDLPGITEKLDYVEDLGVNGIWISPFYPSPMKDFGYDVSDYRDIDPMFGTLSDLDALLDKAHRLNLKIIIDLVLSHTSDQHPWFQDESKKDWHVWADGEKGTPPNNWVSVFGGSAWEWDERYGQYYLHNFLKEQPDLNFHNPEVQEEALDICRFWLERGVDGFRLDVVNFYFHDQELRDNPERPAEYGAATQFEGEDPYSAQAHIHDKSQPENLEFLKRLRALTDEYPDRMTVGEIGDDKPYERSAEYTAGGDLLHTCYNTQMMSGTTKELTASLIRKPIEKFLEQPGGSWPSWAFSNHDVVRSASRWLPDSDGYSYNQEFSKMLIALLGCLYGTVFLYQGEELGLAEAKLEKEDLQDPWGIHLWPEWQGRDGCRTPMPWDDGVLNAQHWLPIPDTHQKLCVDTQKEDQSSVLSFAKTFLNWRKTQLALIQGDIEFLDTNDDHLLAFKRKSSDREIFCIFNLGEQAKVYKGYELPSFGFFIEEYP